MKNRFFSGLLAAAMSVSLFAGVPMPAQAAEQETVSIVNDRFWQDTEGNTIFSQGGGIFKFGDTYYWYGVKYGEAVTYVTDQSKYGMPKDTAPVFLGITCYSSSDLSSWRYEGIVVTPEEVSGKEAIDGEDAAWVGRLGVAYMEDTNTYALFVQHECDDPDNSLDAPDTADDKWSKQVLVLTSDSPAGEFTWNQRINMTSYTGGTSNTGDQTVFTDPDTNKDYLVYSYGRGRGKMFLSEIITQEDGKVGLGKAHMIYQGAGREGNCMFKYNNRYYVCASDLFGWNASHAYYITLDDISDEYLESDDFKAATSMKLMDGSSEDFCHVTQTGFFYTLQGTEQETVLFCGDRWAGFAGNGLGFNQWCPLSFQADGTPYFNSLSAWNLDLTTGTWSADRSNNYVKNGSFDADRVSSTQLAGWENTVIKGDSPIGNDSKNLVTGKFALRLGDKVDYQAAVSQTIKSTAQTELADGVYDLCAKIKNTGDFDSLAMFAKNKNLTVQKEITEAHAEYTEIILPNVSVSGGSVEVGFEAEGKANAYCYVDDVTFVLSESPETVQTGTVTAKITSDTEKPAVITLTSEDTCYRYDLTLTNGIQDVAIAPVQPGSYTMTLTVNACEAENGSQQITVTADAAAAASDITVTNKAGNISGKITDTQGTAIAGVLLTLSGTEFTQTAYTQAGGSYSFTDILAGDYTLTAELAGYRAPEAKNVAVEIGKTASVDTMELENITGTVSGTVTDFDGSAVGNAAVTLRKSDEKDDTTRYRVTTDENGNYTADVVAGTYQILASAEGKSVCAVAQSVMIGQDADVTRDLKIPEAVNVPNGEFESALNAAADWTNTGTRGKQTTRSADVLSGKGGYNIWDGSISYTVELNQTLNNLDNGTYVVSVRAESGTFAAGDQLYVYAKNAAGELLAKEDLPGVNVVSKGETIALMAEVSDHTLTIGLSGNLSAGAWSHVDEFRVGLAEKAEETESVNKQALGALLDEVNALKASDYTEESWQELTAKREAAQTVYEDPRASQEAVDEAERELKAAKDALKESTSEGGGDETTPGGNGNPGGSDETTPGGNGNPGGNDQPTGGEGQTPAEQSVKVSKITFAEKSFKIAAGRKVTLKPQTAPANAADKTIKWKSSNDKYAKVKNGVVTTQKAGIGKTVTITAEAADGSGTKAKVKITIMKHAVTRVSLKAKKTTVKAGKKLTLHASVKTNGKKANKNLSYTSSNPKWAVVSKKGVVTAKKAGAGKRVKITAKSTDGTNKKAAVTIRITK